MEGLIKNNKLIADFIGASKTSNCKDNEMFIPDQTICRIDTIELGKGHILKFHKSWDWLMPVVEKISELTSKETFNKSNSNVAFYKILSLNIDTSKQHVYKAVVEFINWYNENKKSN